MNDEKFICPICRRGFVTKSNLNKHLKNVHKLIQCHRYDSTSRFLCPDENCQERFRRDAHLREHLKEHGVEMDVQEYEFNTKEDFEEWLFNIQNETLSEYVKDSATKVLASGYKKDYLYCNRSFQSRCLPDNQRKRKMKSQGSKKIGRSCPSRIEVSTKDGEKLHVRFWKTHYGHSDDIEHLRLDKHSKNEIAAQLVSGAKFEEVLDDIRSREETITNKRLKCLKRKDLYNIVRQFSIPVTYSTKDHRHRDDTFSFLMSSDSSFSVVNEVEVETTFFVDKQDPVTKERLIEKTQILENLIKERNLDDDVSQALETKLDELINDLVNISGDSSC